MADLYTTIAGITVDANDILSAELFARQVLQAQFPDIDLRQGTGLYDMVVRPTAHLLATIKKGSDYYFSQNTLAGVTDTTDTAVVDNLMSNWFLQRRQGTNAVISARLYFARQKNVSITPDIYFSPDNTTRFFPQITMVIPAASMSYDAYQNEYYYDMDLVAESTGSQYNLSAGSLLYFSTFDPYFLHAEINFLRQTAMDVETNTAFLTRSQNAISTRNLVNVPSIVSNLQSNFPILANILPIGGGEAEMIRDAAFVQVSALANPLLVHLGGMTDIYCRTSVVTSVVQSPTDANGRVTLTGPIFDVTRSSVSGGSSADTVPLTVSQTISSLTSSGNVATATITNHGYSTGESVTISNASVAGYNGTFTITVVDLNTFTYPVVGPLASPATANANTTLTATINTPYTLTHDSVSAQTLTSLTSSNGVATATLNNHSFFPGRWITISGATPSGYDGTFVIQSTTADTFTYNLPAGTGALANATGTIAVTGVQPYKDNGFSNRQIIYIDFGAAYANSTASFQIRYFQDLDGVQFYLEDPNNRVTAGDLLARAYNSYLLDISIIGYAGQIPDQTVCETIVTNYLNGLTPGDSFIMADLQAALSAGGVKSVKTPVSVAYNLYTRDQLAPVTGTITDYLDPQDRTATFSLNSLTTSTQTI